MSGEGGEAEGEQWSFVELPWGQGKTEPCVDELFMVNMMGGDSRHPEMSIQGLARGCGTQHPGRGKRLQVVGEGPMVVSRILHLGYICESSP